MPFRDLLKKKDKIQADADHGNSYSQISQDLAPPEFKIVRSDTHTEEVLSTPSQYVEKESSVGNRSRGSSKGHGTQESPPKDKEHRRLSDVLHLRSRSKSPNSAAIPSNLPDLQGVYANEANKEEKEAQWEQRATVLAAARPITPTNIQHGQVLQPDQTGRSRSASDAQSDVNIQNAISLHETGKLEEATAMFKVLANRGNVLSEVLYGLSLRHGWGCQKDEATAFTYLSSAASDSAKLEAAALEAGLKKGGAAKGELVLAIFELGNCYRYGWGTAIDKPAARQYYETAANLGDTDAMNEAAWCYLEGFGGKKDKFKAAQLLRLAEKNGSKTLGNTWIWKDKYNS